MLSHRDKRQGGGFRVLQCCIGVLSGLYSGSRIKDLDLQAGRFKIWGFGFRRPKYSKRTIFFFGSGLRLV